MQIKLRNRLPLAGGILLFAFYILLINEQLEVGAGHLSCWFYSEALQEHSPSELFTNAAWFLSALLLMRRYRSEKHLAYLAFALFTFAMFLEESNYGHSLVGLLQGDAYQPGKSVHNVLESSYANDYWNLEFIVLCVLLGVSFTVFPIYLWRKTRSKTALLSSLVPVLVWGWFLWKEFLWEKHYGLPLYPNHPCVSLDEEIYESLFAAASLLFIALDWMTVPRGLGQKRAE